MDINNLAQCSISESNWNDILEVKKAVSKALEEKRTENIIGSSLDADIIIYCSRDLYNTLNALNGELKFIFITSNASLRSIDEKESSNNISINNHLLAIDIKNSNNKKCERCWHKCKTVGINKKYGNICHRCITNVYGEGEIRINA